MALGILILALVGTELLLRAIAGLRGTSAEANAYRGEPQMITAYRLQFTGQDGHTYDGLPHQGQLKATRSPLMGYQLLAGQSSPFWAVNEQGFRDDEPVPLEKPAGEIRIFVLGGSAAFGQLSNNNQATFAHQLESQLNDRVAAQRSKPEQYQPTVLPYRRDLSDQAMALPVRIPEGQYRVINAAVPGYASGNELSQLAHQVLAYRPNMVILLDGYTDLMLPSNQAAADVPDLEPLLTNSFEHLTTHLSQQLRALAGNAYLVKGLQYLVFQPRQNPASMRLITSDQSNTVSQQFADDPEELQQRVARYRYNLQKMARLTADANIPFIVAIQPEITGRQSITEPEADILTSLGSAYPERIEQGYVAIADSASQVRKQFPNTMKALNLRTLYASEPTAEPAFESPIHLSGTANKMLAARLYQTIIEATAIEPVPFNQTR